MEEQTATTPKKTTRRKTAASQTAATPPDMPSPQPQIGQNFDEVVDKIIQSKQEFDNLQKEIVQVKQDWVREQKQHEADLVQQKSQEELERKREQETYQYNTNLSRKRAEDEFQDKKLAWEKDLLQRKEELEAQRRELEQLRKLAASFDEQKQKTVKEAQDLTERQLREQFDQEKKLTDQQVKAEKEILSLKISNLEAENSRLNKEIEVLRRSLDEATRQVKEIAVKVIESGSQSKNQTPVDKIS